MADAGAVDWNDGEGGADGGLREDNDDDLFCELDDFDMEYINIYHLEVMAK